MIWRYQGVYLEYYFQIYFGKLTSRSLKNRILILVSLLKKWLYQIKNKSSTTHNRIQKIEHLFP